MSLRLRVRQQAPALAVSTRQTVLDQRKRVRRGVRVRYGRARLAGAMVRARARGDDVFLIVDDLRSLTPSVRRVLRATRGQAVALNFNPDVADADPSSDRLPVRRFWLSVSGGQPPDPRGVVASDAATAGPVPVGEDEWLDGAYIDGVPSSAVSVRVGGSVVTRYGPDGRPARDEQHDSAGRLVRVVDRHPATGKPTTHRYFDAGRSCWLSVWVNEKGALRQTQQHRGDQREYPSFRHAQAAWLRTVVAGADNPRLFTTGRASARVKAILEQNQPGLDANTR